MAVTKSNVILLCDVSLDYIKIYEPVAAGGIIYDRMQQEIMTQTKQNGFHFVG
jgi:hypothetical protein